MWGRGVHLYGSREMNMAVVGFLSHSFRLFLSNWDLQENWQNISKILAIDILSQLFRGHISG